MKKKNNIHIKQQKKSIFFTKMQIKKTKNRKPTTYKPTTCKQTTYKRKKNPIFSQICKSQQKEKRFNPIDQQKLKITNLKIRTSTSKKEKKVSLDLSQHEKKKEKNPKHANPEDINKKKIYFFTNSKIEREKANKQKQ